MVLVSQNDSVLLCLLEIAKDFLDRVCYLYLMRMNLSSIKKSSWLK